MVHLGCYIKMLYILLFVLLLFLLDDDSRDNNYKNNDNHDNNSWIHVFSPFKIGMLWVNALLFVLFLFDYCTDAGHGNSSNCNNDYYRIHNFAPLLILYYSTYICFIARVDLLSRRPRKSRHTYSRSAVLLWRSSFQMPSDKQNTERSTR